METASGAQLKRGRVMRTSTKIVFVLGVLTLPAGGAGIVFLILGLLDYYVLTKETTHFLSRDNPAEPVAEKPGKFLPIAVATLVALMLIGLVASVALKS